MRWTHTASEAKEQIVNMQVMEVGPMDSLPELRAREEEIAREWQWLHDTLNEVARVRAEDGEAEAFRLMQAQAMRVGERRIEIGMLIAALEGSG